ncbi:hypothetical protein [Haloferax sp. DFSO60]|uniref:hypothetical protein n=1 Tax=Haloferax sp. DFSO60 TaxID=3388652 RepID=UPI00397B664D
MTSTRRDFLRLIPLVAVSGASGCVRPVFNTFTQSPDAWQVSTVISDLPLLSDASTEPGSLQGVLIQNSADAREHLRNTEVFDPAENGYFSLDYSAHVVSVVHAVLREDQILTTRVTDISENSLRMTATIEEKETDYSDTHIETTLITWQLNGHPKPATLELVLSDKSDS